MRFFNRKRLNQYGFDHIFMAVAFVVIMGVVGAGYIVVNGHRTTGVSHAATYVDTYCDSSDNNICLNAWGGGPWVDIYNGRAIPNGEFSLIDPSGKNNGFALEFVGGGTWSGKCIGDSYNSSSTYDTSLDPCPTASSSGGWGTNFTVVDSGCGSDQFAFKNDHWDRWLWAGGSSDNGDNWWLTGESQTCLTFKPA